MAGVGTGGGGGGGVPGGGVRGGIPEEKRLEGTIAASCQAVYAGAQMVRVHDVQENLRAIRMLEAILCPSHI